MNTAHKDKLEVLAVRIRLYGGAVIVAGTIWIVVWRLMWGDVERPVYAAVSAVRAHADSLYTVSENHLADAMGRLADVLDTDPGSLARHRMVERLKANH